MNWLSTERTCSVRRAADIWTKITRSWDSGPGTTASPHQALQTFPGTTGYWYSAVTTTTCNLTQIIFTFLSRSLVPDNFAHSLAGRGFYSQLPGTSHMDPETLRPQSQDPGPVRRRLSFNEDYFAAVCTSVRLISARIQPISSRHTDIKLYWPLSHPKVLRLSVISTLPNWTELYWWLTPLTWHRVNRSWQKQSPLSWLHHYW